MIFRSVLAVSGLEVQLLNSPDSLEIFKTQSPKEVLSALQLSQSYSQRNFEASLCYPISSRLPLEREYLCYEIDVTVIETTLKDSKTIERTLLFRCATFLSPAPLIRV